MMRRLLAALVVIFCLGPIAGAAPQHVTTAPPFYANQPGETGVLRTLYPFGNVLRYGADPTGATDSTAAIRRAIDAAAQTSGAVVFFPPGLYKVTSGFTLSRSVQILGYGSPPGGTGAQQEPYAVILSAFNGDLFTFTGSAGAVAGSGGGIENMRLVQASGSRVTAAGAGTAIKLTGTSRSNRPSWFKVRNVIIEYGVGTDSWTWGIDVDGTAITGGVIPDLWFDQVSAHTASSNGGAVRFKAATAKVFSCAFYDTAGNVTITGIAGTPSRSVQLFNTDISGTLALDYADDIVVFGGTITTITNTMNTGGASTIIPGRLVNPFTSANNKAGAAFGVLRYDTHSFASAPGSWRVSQAIALENGQSIHGINSEGTRALRIARVNSANRVELSGDGADIQLGQGIVANGGGATPVLGTIGGSGPARAPQAGWVKFYDASGNAFWVPFWR
jgi:Pectate lyase superfamily protein